MSERRVARSLFRSLTLYLCLTYFISVSLAFQHLLPAQQDKNLVTPSPDSGLLLLLLLTLALALALTGHPAA